MLSNIIIISKYSRVVQRPPLYIRQPQQKHNNQLQNRGPRKQRKENKKVRHKLGTTAQQAHKREVHNIASRGINDHEKSSRHVRVLPRQSVNGHLVLSLGERLPKLQESTEFANRVRGPGQCNYHQLVPFGKEVGYQSLS